ncbi:alpha/beta hydrolase [Streptomyces sp. Ru73]|uniref:alpha/beta fold hydrolase n=1 Tax=Streptomyces sp. Ru73 TaxID=2080748 RepID=UPI000CDD7F7A|nr:alpha/beta fold hydrolase [Streptomyces sp. Ru73]POX40518.1 alpha/beta hydrolase [Streptomyces sp. Ru73]
MSAPDATYADVAGHPVRVRISGPADGPPVVLLHGIARSLEDWQLTHDLLAARGYRVISTDLPGFGLTRRMAGRAGLASFARAVVGVLDALGERRPVHLMGNSLGGAVAMTVAAEHPGRVATLVLANSAGFGREANLSLRPMAYAVLAALPGVGRRFRARARDAGVQVNRDLFHDPRHATEEMIRHAGEVGRQPDFRATFAATLLRLGVPALGSYPGWRRALLARTAAARVPTLVVWGDADTVLPVKHFHAAVAALPHARSHLFPATGHMPQIERAAEFAELAAGFLDTAAGPAKDAEGDGTAAAPAARAPEGGPAEDAVKG